MSRDSAPAPRVDFPVLAKEVIANKRFPFIGWAAANRFRYPKAFEAHFTLTESAAEAYYLRALFDAGATPSNAETVRIDELTVTVQAKVWRYHADFLVSGGVVPLAVEVDGLGFHRWSQEQMAADYLRDRRMLLRGVAVARFTAKEVFTDAAECWRQTRAIMETLRRG